MKMIFKEKWFILFPFLVLVLQGCREDSEVEVDKVLFAENTPLPLEVPAKNLFGSYIVPSDNPQTRYGVELGRMLFYEKRLSGDNSMSCASCHQQKFGFTDGQPTSPGIDGIHGNRSTMALANMLWETQFFWDGRSPSLEHQALQPIQNPIELNTTLDEVIDKLENSGIYPEMFAKAFGDSKITADRIGKAIAQFERTLISSNSKFDKFLRNEATLTESELRGFNLFTHPVPGVVRGGNCADCHLGYTFINPELKNNGVDKVVGDPGLENVTGNPADRGKFKVPSLRNIELTAPYMHDGRFETLEEVLDHYNDTTLFGHENVDFLITSATNEPNGQSLLLTKQEKEDIIAFLRTLTDTSFVNNPKFSNPFE